jgi:hypothetical protein
MKWISIKGRSPKNSDEGKKNSERTCRICQANLRRSEIMRGLLTDYFICKKCFYKEETRNNYSCMLIVILIGPIFIGIIILIAKFIAWMFT